MILEIISWYTLILFSLMGFVGFSNAKTINDITVQLIMIVPVILLSLMVIIGV